MTERHRTTLNTLALAIGLASGALAQNSPLQITEEKPGLFKQAKVTPADAQKTAQARFPAATIKSGELEMEDGKLIYSFDIQQTGVRGTEEVHIDAMTGLVIATEHEEPPRPKGATPPRPPKKPPAS